MKKWNKESALWMIMQLGHVIYIEIETVEYVKIIDREANE